MSLFGKLSWPHATCEPTITVPARNTRATKRGNRMTPLLAKIGYTSLTLPDLYCLTARAAPRLDHPFAVLHRDAAGGR
jgi:hypothetical protein